MARIENHKYSIEEAFRECFYVVPDYQREYVWQEKEVQQLLDDIGEQIDGNGEQEYFIGTVLVSPGGDKNHYELIDGQQRLTTFFLLLCALRQHFGPGPHGQILSSLICSAYTAEDGAIRTVHKLEPRYESAGEVIGKLVALNAPPESVRSGIQSSGIPSFGSLDNLVNAYAVIHRHIGDQYAEPEALAKYWKYLARNVVFIQISTDVSSALKIFETINERGVGLNPMDLLKNLLFTNVRQQDFTKLKDEWKKITKPLEQEKEKPLRFLRYFLMANYQIKNARGDAVVREDEIYDWFVNKENAALCDYVGKPFEFVRKIIRNVDNYIAFTRGFGNDGKPSLVMHSLKSLCGGAFSLHHVLLLAASNLPKSLFDHFVAQLESFLFYYIFTKTPTKELERNFSVWADELREIGSITDAASQKEALNAFLARRFEASIAAKRAELSDAMKRYSLNSMQQYRTRYLLAKITQHVEMAFIGMKEPTSLDPFLKLEIEHILPDKPGKELRAQFEEQNPGLSYDEQKNRLGNLTLLEKPINIVAGNDYFDAKRPEYEKSGNYLTRSICGLTTVGANTSINRINEKLKSFPAWSAAAIEERRAVLQVLAGDVWSIKLLESA